MHVTALQTPTHNSGNPISPGTVVSDHYSKSIKVEHGDQLMPSVDSVSGSNGQLSAKRRDSSNPEIQQTPPSQFDSLIAGQRASPFLEDRDHSLTPPTD